jgi:hypothetical protein
MFTEMAVGPNKRHLSSTNMIISYIFTISGIKKGRMEDSIHAIITKII